MRVGFVICAVFLSTLVGTVVNASRFPVSVTFAETTTPVGHPNLKIEDGQLWFRRAISGDFISIGKVGVYPEGSRFYHWTSPETEARWSKRKIVGKVDMDYMIAHPNGNVWGGGFYVSTSALDTNAYGEKFVAIELGRETTYLEARVSAQAYLGPDFQEVLKSIGITLVRFQNSPDDPYWINIFDRDLKFRIRAGSVDFLDAGDDFLKSLASKEEAIRSDRLAIFFAAEKKYPIFKTEAVKKAWPEFYKVITDQPLTAAEHSRLLFQLDIKTPTNLATLKNRIFQSSYRSQFYSAFKDETLSGIHTFWDTLEKDEDRKIFQQIFETMGVPPSDLRSESYSKFACKNVLKSP
jgi:hypothetical protein